MVSDYGAFFFSLSLSVFLSLALVSSHYDLMKTFSACQSIVIILDSVSIVLKCRSNQY